MSLSILMLSAAFAGTVKPASHQSSSHLVSDKGESYEAKLLIDGKQESAWIEGEDGSGLGSWVQFELGETKSVTGLKIWNGYWLTHDFWSRHNRAKEIEVEFSDGEKQSFTLADEMKAEVIKFAAAKDTSSIKVRFKSVYRGSTFNDTGLSEIQILDKSSSPWVTPHAYTASSTLTSDDDGNYDLTNLHDGMADSMWCEGSEAGDGSGESIEFDFGGPTSVSKLKMRNGSAGSFSSFMATNRAKAAKLTFSDGSSEAVAVKTSLMEQTIAFPAKSTSKVTITFTEVVKGSRYNDLCISEAKFLP
ncbi:MAG: discoidin domain-containing protein [Myxococcota bacterium]